MAGEYIYLATSFKDGEPIAAFVRKYELADWCRNEAKRGYPSGGWLSLYRLRTVTWEHRFDRVELEYVFADGGKLIDKAP